MNTAPTIDVSQSIITKAYRAAILSTPQCLLDPVNHPLIDIICPVMLKNTYCVSMWPTWQSDEAIAPHGY
jgi:hypothetical protein